MLACTWGLKAKPSPFNYW